MLDFLEGEIVLCAHHEPGVSSLTVGQPSFFIRTSSQSLVFEEPSLYLHERIVARGIRTSPHTWAAVAQALKTWFQYLQILKRDWRLASSQDRIDYRDAYMVAISPKTGGKYHASTVKSRMSVIRDFYIYARDAEWYDGDIGSNLCGSDFRHYRDVDLPKARPNLAIHPLTRQDLRALLQYAGPRATQKMAGDQRLSRNRIIFDLGWAVGLRVGEIAALTILQFLALAPDPLAPSADQQLSIVRKGGKTCAVAIPNWLVSDILAYIEGERAAVLQVTDIPFRNQPIRLFLSQYGSSRQSKPISISRMQGIFEEACLGIGRLKIVDCIDPEGANNFFRKRARHSIHDLRHTYAVLTYHAERMSGNPEPWKKIQAQLGHKHLQTTIDIYLAHVEVFNMQPGLYDVRKIIGL
ncbi:Site-specific recombinase XerD [Cupriavidus necator]|nr:recombinase XerD [Cupriavidus necator H16]QQB78525.1 site-specific integrase [Cupriavidus necator]